jgi:hypothetical protein
MSFERSSGADDWGSEPTPLHRTVAVLHRQWLDTAELLTHVNQARQCAGITRNIRSLLDGMSCELNACCRLLQDRIAQLSPYFMRTRQSRIESESSFWRLFHIEESDCATHLEALLSGFAHYARRVSDSVTFMELMGDVESLILLERISAVAERGMWFIELYMESLALHMDGEHLPEFTTSIEIRGNDVPNSMVE